jgi:hypothetical protein
MNLDEAGTGMPGRTEAFSHGVNGTPTMVASGLAEQSAMFNSQVPGRFTPHSVLQGLPGMSGNGMSEEDAQRKLPGGYTLPSSNGMATGDYDSAMKLRLLGSRGEM